MGSELLNRLVIFSYFLHWDLIYSLFLRSLNFSHFVQLRIGVFRRTFSFINNSSWSQTCSRLDSTNPYCASCDANLCASVCCCSSPMHLLRDSTWSSCFARSDLAWLSKWSLLPSRRDPLRFDGLAFLNTELPIKVPCSDEHNASGFPEAFCACSGEVSIFCNSPSSRSESAMLSAESSKCMFDWKLDVSDSSESDKPCVPISPNSITYFFSDRGLVTLFSKFFLYNM